MCKVNLLFFKEQKIGNGYNGPGCNAVVLILLLRGIWVFLASLPLQLVTYVEICIWLEFGVKKIFNPLEKSL